MYELCALLATKKVKKARKPAVKGIRVGDTARCFAFGIREVVITRKEGSRLFFQFNGKEQWAERKLFDAI